MPPQFKPGYKPKIPPTRLLVFGVWDFDDFEVLEYVLDRFTVRLELIEVILTGYGTRAEQNGEWVWVGADWNGRRWAEKNWWTRLFCYAPYYGKGRTGEQLRDEEVLQLLGRDGYALLVWDGNDYSLADLADKVREQIEPCNFRTLEV